MKWQLEGPVFTTPIRFAEDDTQETTPSTPAILSSPSTPVCPGESTVILFKLVFLHLRCEYQDIPCLCSFSAFPAMLDLQSDEKQ